MADQKITFAFEGGVQGGAVPDVVQPPAFTSVQNVRHTIQRGAPVKAPKLYQDGAAPSYVSGSELCTGVVPHPRSKSCLFAFDAPTRVTRAGAAPLPRHDGADPRITTVRTLEVVDAGVTMPGRSSCVPSVAMRPDGGMWIAQAQQSRLQAGASSTYDGDVSAYVSFVRSDGVRVLDRMLACLIETGAAAVVSGGAWCSITAHADGSAILWYRAANVLAADQPIRCRRLTIDATGSLVVGLESTVLSPAMSGLQKCLTPAVVADDTSAWVMCPISTTAVRVVRVTLSTLTVAATVDLGVPSGGSYANAACSLGLATGASGGVVAAIVAPAVAGWWLLDATTLATLASDTNAAGLAVGSCCALSYEAPTGELYVGGAFSAGNVTMSLNASTPIRVRPTTYVSLRRIGGAGEFYNGEIPHSRLAAGYQANGGTGSAPIFAISPWYGTYTDLSDPAVVLDPAITLVALKPIPGGRLEFGPCGRFGVDRVTPEIWSRGAAGGFLVDGTAVWGASMCARGGRFALAYLEASETDNFITDAGLVGRYAVVSLGSHQPPVAQVGDAMAVVGGSMTLYWDGTELAELCALQAPTIWLEDFGVPGSAPFVFDGEFVAVVSWVDAQGRVHRSAPSRPLRVQTSDSTRKLMVTKSIATHAGGAYGPAVCRIYYAPATGSSVHKLLEAMEAEPAEVNGCWVFPLRTQIAVDAPALYTEGGELPPEHPPAAQDALVALDRVWLIDAESRSDVWYSKPVAPGAAPEWNGAFKVTFPAAAGPLVALAEIGGQLIALGARGAAVLYGDGPDPNGNGAFGAPRLVAKLGCASRQSVARYQGGVIYGSAGRWVRLSAEGAQVIPDAGSFSAYAGSAVVFENGSEIAWLEPARALVHNYDAGTWSYWTLPGLAGGSVSATWGENGDPTSAWLVRVAGGVARACLLEGEEASDTEQALWTTGHIIPPGDQQQDVQWSQVVIQGLSSTPHGLSVTIRADYGRLPTQTATWSLAEVDELRDASGRIVVSIDVQQRAARSLRLTISETGATNTAFRPTSCTLYYAIGEKNQNRRVLRPAARR